MQADERAEERAGQLFGQGYYCAEAVVTALAEKMGGDMGTIPQIASGFCSGMSRTGGPCGAVTGAVMGLGLAFGRKEPRDDDASREAMLICYSQVQELEERFLEAFGSGQCRDLTGCDFSTPEGLRRFKEEKGIERCMDFVRTAAALAEKIIDEGSGIPNGTGS